MAYGVIRGMIQTLIRYYTVPGAQKACRRIITRVKRGPPARQRIRPVRLVLALCPLVPLVALGNLCGRRPRDRKDTLAT